MDTTVSGTQDDPVEFWKGELARSGVAEHEIAEMADHLMEFCDFAGSSPRELIRRVLRDGNVIVKERKKLEDEIERFSGGSVKKANAVRSFMIHNGVRMIAPKPSWL